LELLTLVRLYPQCKSYHTLVYWCFITACRAVWFFYDYLLASSDLHLPAPFPEERTRWVSRYFPKNNYLRYLFLFVGDFSFIRGYRKHECTCSKK